MDQKLAYIRLVQMPHTDVLWLIIIKYQLLKGLKWLKNLSC